MALKTKKIIKFLRKNYFLSIFFAIILFVGFAVVVKTIFTKPTYIYVKVKVGQGLWWASTQKPGFWYINSFKKGEISKDFFGSPEAEILNVRYYPQFAINQYDAYVNLKLKAAYNKKSGEYKFSRSTLYVSSPIAIQFSNVEVSGTVVSIDLSQKDDKYIEKTISIVAKGGYTKDFPYLYDSIQIGDKYFDGVDNIFEVIDKKLEQNVISVNNNITGEVFERSIDTLQNIIIKAKIKVKEEDGKLIFAQEHVVRLNTIIPFSTNNYDLKDFVIREIHQ